jgi:lambda family phage portal protein
MERERRPPGPTWLDRVISFVAPRTGLKRLRARYAHELLGRHYEGAAAGRRTQGWSRSSGDINAVAGPALGRLRDVARDLVRNNPYAESALTTICDHVVGWGIVAKPKPTNKRAADLWKKWAETTACDSDGLHDFYGLQKLVMRTVVESGECLIRRRFRRPDDGLPIPVQLQVLDPDYIDTAKTETIRNRDGVVVRRILHGVEFDTLGRRTAYWLFADHPGGEQASGTASYAVPAESILHVFKATRPGQVRGPSWFASVLLRFKDFDEYEDATLMKQKIAACLAVLVSDTDGSAAPLGTADTAQDPQIDSLEPGWIGHIPPGAAVTVVDPPAVREYSDYARTSLRAIATGLGVTYEDLTGDYANMPFSAARMSRLRHQARVDDWQWRVLIPQFCQPAWEWAMQAAIMASAVTGLKEATGVEWTTKPMPMIDPSVEGLAAQRNIRSGLKSWQESVRELGYDPDTVLAEMAKDNARFDKLGIILDSDPRKTTQAGQPFAVAAAKPPAPEPDEPEPKPNGKAAEA